MTTGLTAEKVRQARQAMREASADHHRILGVVQPLLDAGHYRPGELQVVAWHDPSGAWYVVVCSPQDPAPFREDMP